MSTSITKDLGPVTSYAYAVSKGYTGTEEEFAQAMADAVQAVSDAEAAATSIDDMTVAASGLAAGANPTATVSEVSGHKHIAFGIPKGDTGATGPVPEFSIGTVSTGVSGSSAAATITGTDDEPVLNLTIPRGNSGDTDIVAPSYSDLTFPVKEGQPCIYNDKCYVAKQDIASSESWTAAHWQEATMSEQMQSLIKVSENEPTDPSNKLWIVDDDVQEYTVPTYAEFSDLSSAIEYTNNATGVYENLWDTSKVVADHYYANGAEVSNGSCSYIIIPCTAGDTFVFGNNGETATARFVNTLAKNGGNLSTSNNISTITISGTAKKLAVTFKNDVAKPQINRDTLQPYVPYGSSAVMEDVKALKASAVHPIQKTEGMTIPVGVDDEGKLFAAEPVLSAKKYKSLYVTGNLSDGDYLIFDKETALKKGESLMFSCNVTTFDKLVIGWSRSTPGTEKYPYCEITNTSIVVYGTNNNGQAHPTLTHGLSISVNLQFRMTINHDTIDVELISNGERYTGTAEVFKGNQGYGFAMSSGSTLTDCRLSWCGSDIDKIIWMFGDSYFGIASPSRWMYYLQDDGYADNALIDSYPGRGSDNAILTLNSLITLGKPNYIIWCMGMNDGSDTNASTPSSTWVTGRDAVLEICDAYGITPVFATIPNVPSTNHTAKNAWVKASGYRYIDFAKAVGAESSGSYWYNWGNDTTTPSADSMLSSDKVHPTAKGAKALYGQFLADFPEITID